MVLSGTIPRPRFARLPPFKRGQAASPLVRSCGITRWNCPGSLYKFSLLYELKSVEIGYFAENTLNTFSQISHKMAAEMIPAAVLLIVCVYIISGFTISMALVQMLLILPPHVIYQ
ncbi:hypothetical protein D1646_02860 [Pseudoflavonifractor sp. 60]|nr:hypothetical protein [Pseudoflavonifractor sp. 60]